VVEAGRMAERGALPRNQDTRPDRLLSLVRQLCAGERTTPALVTGSARRLDAGRAVSSAR
jgi:hypothetical protein